jgi:hypothetical protein
MRTLLILCLAVLSVTLFQCTEEDFFDKVKKSKGSVIGTINGQLYSDLKPKSIYSTEVVVKKITLRVKKNMLILKSIPGMIKNGLANIYILL